MICPNCGNKMEDDSKFCTSCGHKVEKEIMSTDEAGYKTLRCNECGGTMKIDEDKNIIRCPYCGSEKLVVESDFVKVAKYKIQSEKDVKLERIKADNYLKLETVKAKNALAIAKAKSEGRETRWMMLGIIILALLLFALGIYSDHQKNEKIEKLNSQEIEVVSPTFNSFDLIDKDFDFVMEQLKEDGFTNIKTLEVSPGLLLNKKGKVILVTIDDEAIMTDSVYGANETVVVKYFSKGE